jgi:delta 1-pyrroline-5-carboxylate dehydrogenase
MGTFIYQKTKEPFRIYVYDNETDIKIVLNRLIENEDNTIFIQKISCSKDEIPILKELIENAIEVL